jgi:RNA polymerase sigma factor (sigma-70 family)
MGAASTAHSTSKERMAELYQIHSQAALRLAFAVTGDEELAQDLVQEAFVRVFGRFADRREPESFERYLRTTILNLARTVWRKRAFERAFRRSSHGPEISASADPTEKHAVWSALLRLPQRQRAALYLRYYEDLSEKQVADVLDLSVPAARSLLMRARKSLAEKARDHDDG